MPMTKERRSAGSALLTLLVLLAAACSSTARTEPSRSSGRTTPSAVAEVTVEGMHGHLEALQAIADEHDGTRAVGTPGYEASVGYVDRVLRDAGYEVELRSVDVPVFEQDSETALERVEPSLETWADGTDLRAMLFSGAGEVRARVTVAEGGCEPADLSGFPDGDVALLEPGPCLRRQQVLNAQDAGASAVIVLYPDTAPGRPLRPTLLYPEDIEVPVLAVTPNVGDALAPTGGERPTVHLRVSAASRWTQAASVVAHATAGDPNRVVMLGAHLDSVMDGPGINDNGSGAAMLLEIARWLATREPEATVRFAFWAGEEEGLYGSRDYVQALSEDQRDALVAYLDLDMVASPNFVRYVVADAPMDPSAAEGTELIADLFTRSFEDRGLEVEPIETYGGADHGSFAAEGIPVGGLFAGSAEIKTAAQEAATGGAAGEPVDACYHQACDTISNVSDEALEQFAAAYVYVLTELASVDVAA